MKVIFHDHSYSMESRENKNVYNDGKMIEGDVCERYNKKS